MSLLDLPLELLDEIINLTYPFDIEAFALSCKAVYVRSVSQLTRHNALEKTWRSTTTNYHRGAILRI